MAENILEALDAALRGEDDLEEVVGSFFQLAHDVDPNIRTKMLESLEPRFRAHPPERTGQLAIEAEIKKRTS